MAAPITFADANVLYSSPLRDLLMQLSVDGTMTLRWSQAVQDEWATALLRTRPELSSQIVRTHQAMSRSLPDAAVTGYEQLVATLVLPDPNDRHVLAAAIHAGATVLLTFNLKDFPQHAINGAIPVVVHPDDFMVQVANTMPSRTRQAITAVLDRLSRPPLTIDQYCNALERAGLPKFARTVPALFGTA